MRDYHSSNSGPVKEKRGGNWRHQTVNNERATKTIITTTACLALALVAGSQSAEQHVELMDAQYLEAVQSGIVTFWKQVALMGAMATAVFYTVTHKTK